jgi:cysteine desulfurase/selenocysteine lyase
VPYVPTFCGVVQPVEEIGRVARKTGALYAVNATQAVGRFPIDVGRIGCDFLFGTSRKWLRGPRGLGFLYVRKAIIPELRPPYMGARCAEWVGPTEYRLAQDIERLQTGDYPYVLLAGLEAAASFAHDVGLEWIGERSAHLGALARERFSEIRGVTVYDIAHGSLATVPVNVAGISGDQVVREMGMRGIVCCTIVEENCLLALRSLGLAELVRISIHYYNTEAEIDKAAAALEEMAAVRG